MKPLIANWRRLGAWVCIFYDEGMAVASDWRNYRCKCTVTFYGRVWYQVRKNAFGLRKLSLTGMASHMILTITVSKSWLEE